MRLDLIAVTIPVPRPHIVLALSLALVWSSVQTSSEAPLDNDIQHVLVEEGLVGIAWALVGADAEPQLGWAGLKDNESKAAFAPGTRFHVGSLTKALLATGVLRLATEGKLDLDEAVLTLLPELFPGKPPAGFRKVTVRHLLDHTSGLSDAHIWQIFSERSRPDAPLKDAFPNPGTQLQLRSQPGSRFSYSNMGYTLLGMVIEAVVGDRYETFLDQSVLAPLGMRDSTFTFTTQAGERADPTLAWGHIDDGSPYAASPMFLRPAGQFTTTSSDLARFAEFLLSDGIINGQAFVDETLMRARGRPVGTEAADHGLIAGYALGLARRDRHGVVGYCHGGNTVGFVAMLCIFPDDNKAFAYGVNTDSETANYGRLDSLMIEALDVAPFVEPPSTNPAPNISDWYGRYVLSPNRFAMFEYLDTVFGSVKVSAREGSLALTSVQRDDRLLRPVGNYLFSAGDRSTTSHVFYRSASDEHLMSDGFATFEKVPAAYLVAHWTSLALGVAGLAWMVVAGGGSLIRHRSKMFRRAEAPGFIASLLLFVPIPLFATQSFMTLGDLTPATASLAAVTAALPIGMLLTLLLAIKRRTAPRINLLHGIAAVLVLQWCAVLGMNGLLPLRLWG